MRIAGVTIPDNKRLEISLTSIYGVGRSRARKILESAGVKPGKTAKDITEKEEGSIRKELESYKIEGDLKREVSTNIKRLKDTGTHRGDRHSKGLPVRGQRTKTNSRTARPYQGRKTMGSGRVKVDKK